MKDINKLTLDMTRGKPSALLLRFSLPLVAGNFFSTPFCANIGVFSNYDKCISLAVHASNVAACVRGYCYLGSRMLWFVKKRERKE
ncbi:MAG: hypothetical protein NC434_05880 [Ruminococcus sp.]|nr:hypothetical protein [Ruminococcus sp.]